MSIDHRFEAIQDQLLELRDARISILPAPNGLVACEKDGTPSSIVRMRIPHVLAAADRADREAGIHRVRVDDATVERVYAEISHNLTPVIGRNRLRDRDGEQPEPLRPHIEAAARAVLAALTGAGS